MKAALILVLLQTVLPSLHGEPVDDPWFLSTKDWYVTATGCVRCYNKPMKYVKIILKDSDFLFDETMATGSADGNGCFTITGKGRDGLDGKPDPYIVVEYRYQGSYGTMEVESIVFGENKSGKTAVKPYSRNVDFGTFKFESINCKCYTEFFDAIVDYNKRAKIPLPYGTLHIRTGVLIHGGTAYSTTDMIRIPNSYSAAQITPDLALHELAHTLRHSFDGGEAHFTWDAARFWYLRTHSCSTKSNDGYAFNEGWAAFWENSCYGTYGSSPTDYTIEGNVAKGLRYLRSKCFSSDETFIKILKRKPGSIHSFSEFNDAHQELYSCKV